MAYSKALYLSNGTYVHLPGSGCHYGSYSERKNPFSLSSSFVLNAARNRCFMTTEPIVDAPCLDN